DSDKVPVIKGGVYGGAGDDIINLDGADVQGENTISGGIGDDEINLNSGTFKHVDAGDGDDVVNWNARDTEIQGSKLIEMGDGSDELYVKGYGHDIQGATLDGGDDASSDDGWVDTLTLDHVNDTISGDQLLNWEVIEISNHSDIQ